MRLPFVWRSEHDARVADLKAVIAMCDEDLRQSREERRELQGQLHQMRMQGATPVPPAPAELLPLPPREPDELKALIAEVCGDDIPKRRLMLRQLASDRAQRVPEEQIRTAILNGIEGTGVPL